MAKIVAIHQPNYVPWLGYFFKIYQSDVFVFLDDVQFANEGMQNYHYIKTSQGSYRLKIPVVKSFGQLINEVKTRDELKWKNQHLRTLEMNYKKAPFFKEVFSDFSQLLESGNNNLSELDTKIIQFISGKFNFGTKFTYSSELGLTTAKEEKVLDICEKLGATVYYSGTGAKAYQKPEDFESCGIELRYSVFKPFKYPQLWGDFQSNVTVLDYLMNCGYDWDRVVQNQQSH